MRTTVRDNFLRSPIQSTYTERNGVLSGRGLKFRLQVKTPHFNAPSIFCLHHCLNVRRIPRKGVPSTGGGDGANFMDEI